MFVSFPSIFISRVFSKMLVVNEQNLDVFAGGRSWFSGMPQVPQNT